MTPEKRAWIFLNQVPMLGPVRMHQLLEKWPRADDILHLSVGDLRQAGISSDLAGHWARCFKDAALANRIDREIEQSERGDFKILTELDESYPAALKNFLDRPPVLYVRGQWPLEGWMIGLVGTRHATPYGLDAAKRITRELVAAEATTVSGLAAGIDTIVHQTTIEEGGRTVAVLGHGLEHVYPRSNERLYKEVTMSGTLITEYGFGTPPAAGQFPRRNRIIAGLSQAVVVVEAPLRSGSMITAREAVEQGREVMAVPGQIFQPQSSGCHKLIRDGATLITSGQDVLEALGIAPRLKDGADVAVDVGIEKDKKIEGLSSFEKALYNNMRDMPISVDELVLLMRAPVDRLANALLSLELRGLVRQLPGQQYARTYN